MTKIITLIILTFSFYSNLLAENDINKLSKEDRKQCEMILNLHTEYYYHTKALKYTSHTKKDIDISLKYLKKDYSHQEIYLSEKYTMEDYKHHLKFIKKFQPNAKEVTFAHFILNDESTTNIYIIKKSSKILGITRVFDTVHHSIETMNFDYFNVGYFISAYDYYTKILKLGNKITNGIKNSTRQVFIKTKPKQNISYIKIKNCFVEEYYLNLNKKD